MKARRIDLRQAFLPLALILVAQIASAGETLSPLQAGDRFQGGIDAVGETDCVRLRLLEKERLTLNRMGSQLAPRLQLLQALG